MHPVISAVISAMSDSQAFTSGGFPPPQFAAALGRVTLSPHSLRMLQPVHYHHSFSTHTASPVLADSLQHCSLLLVLLTKWDFLATNAKSNSPLTCPIWNIFVLTWWLFQKGEEHLLVVRQWPTTSEDSKRVLLSLERTCTHLLLWAGWYLSLITWSPEHLLKLTVPVLNTGHTYIKAVLCTKTDTRPKAGAWVAKLNFQEVISDEEESTTHGVYPNAPSVL